jgi:hypothetical protein
MDSKGDEDAVTVFCFLIKAVPSSIEVEIISAGTSVIKNSLDEPTS